MADIFRDSPFGQILRVYFHREMAPFEDEKAGFDLRKVLSKPESDGKDAKSPSRRSSSEVSRALAYTKYKSESSIEARQSTIRTTSVDVHQDNENVQIVGFGENDQDNPQNWSQWKKSWVYFQICLLTFTIYTGSAIISPAEPIFEKSFGASKESSSLALSMYVLGYGFGPLLFSPLAEVPELGRNVSYMSSFLLFNILTAVGSAVNNYPGFIVIRFLQGFFGGPVLATGSASAQDLYAFHKLPYAMATWAMFVFAGPAFGPVMSGFATTEATWRWGMWEILLLSVPTFIVLFFFLPETNAEYILSQRAKRLRAKTANRNLKTEVESEQGERDWLKIVGYHLTMPFKITIMDPSIAFINLYTALMYSIYYTFFESFPLVYLDVYGFSPGCGALVYIAVLIGGFIGLGTYVTVVRCVYEPYVLENGIGNPEWRLFPGIFGAAFQPVALFLFGYASKKDINWPTPTMGICIFAISAFLVLNVIFVYLPISYPRYAASIFAANGFLRSALATGSIHFATPLFGNLGVGNGCAILGSVSAIYAVLFLGLYRYGAWLRKKSKFTDA